MAENAHPLAAEHLPFFITPPGQTDVLLVAMGIFLVALILLLGVFYFKLHALPEQMSHHANNKAQFEIVAVLALLALFTHNNLFWVAALILAMIRFPDFTTPLNSIAAGVERMASPPPPPPPEHVPGLAADAAIAAVPAEPADQKAV